MSDDFHDRAYEIERRVENSDELEGEVTAALFSEANLARFPHRDPDRLERLHAKHESAAPMAEQLDTKPNVVCKWLRVFGIRSRYEGFETHARRVEELEPEDVGLEPLSEEAESDV